MANKKTGLTDADQAAFRQAVRGATLKKPHTKIIPAPVKAPPKRKTLPPTETDTASGPCPFSDFEKWAPVNVNELIHYAVPGIQPKVLRKLKLGQYTIEAVLDLHGNTVEQAKHALAQFLLHCQQQQVRSVLIIHGKGRSFDKPILKNRLNHWLRQTDHVLAFCSAISKNGSTGALYVLLRR